MELPWLYSFVKLAEYLHFGRAASALCLSQSALSVQIRNLESALGVSLFERDRRSVSLTRAGESFRQNVQRILKELEAAKRNAKQSATGEVGTIRIGFVQSAALGIVPKIVRYYREHLPGVQLNMVNLPSAQQVAALLCKDIDVGFIRLPFEAKELAVQPLEEEPFMCFLPRSHPLTKCRKIDPKDLGSESFILYERRQAPGFFDRMLSICLASGFSPNAIQEACEMQTILSMVASEMGVALLPKSSGALGLTEVVMRPLAGTWPASETGTAVLSQHVDDSLIGRFLQVAKAQSGARL